MPGRRRRLCSGTETRFPGALLEVVDVVAQLQSAVGDWGADPSRIALGGDSAGANLAVGAELELRRRGVSPVKALGLVYGAFGADVATDSYRAFGESGWGLTTADMKGYFDHYLSGPGDLEDPRAVPMRADVTGFPPSFLHAAGIDVLRDDSVAFDRHLRAAGVAGSLTVHDGVIHGFMGLTCMVEKSRRMIADLGRQLSDTLRGDDR